MFSDDIKRYARDMFLWTSFWMITAVGGLSGWTYGIFVIGGELIPKGPERIPVVVVYFTGLAIFATTYILTYNRWLKERQDLTKAAETPSRRRIGPY